MVHMTAQPLMAIGKIRIKSAISFKFSFVNAFEDFIPDARISNQWLRNYKGTMAEKSYNIQIKESLVNLSEVH